MSAKQFRIHAPLLIFSRDTKLLSFGGEDGDDEEEEPTSFKKKPLTRPDCEFWFVSIRDCRAEYTKLHAVFDDAEESMATTTIPDFVTNIPSKPSKGKEKEEVPSSKADKPSKPKHKVVEDITEIREKHTREQASKLCVILPYLLCPAPNVSAVTGRKNKLKYRSWKPTSANSQNARAVTQVGTRMILTLVITKRKRSPPSPIWKKNLRNTPKVVCLRQER